MKKRTFTLIIFLCLFIFNSIYGQEPPNPGFENWTSATLFSDPEPYNTFNFLAFLSAGSANITEVSGVTGSAARVETIESFLGDTIPGLMAIGDIFSGDFSGGAAFSSQPDSLTGFFRYDIMPGDTATIITVFKLNTFPVGFGFFQITGSQADFTLQAFDIPDIFFPVDTMMFIVSSGDYPGSWIEIDDLLFTVSNDQIPNNDFEIWNEAVLEEADGWNAFNLLPVLIGSTPPLTKTTDAFNGNFAARLETVETNFFGDMDTIGFLSTAQIDPNTGEFTGGNIPFDYDNNAEFSLVYKYIPVDNNDALVNLVFSDNGNIVHDTIFEIPESADYTGISYYLDIPAFADSVNITFASSDFREDSYHVVPGDVLYLDNMFFSITFNTSEIKYNELLKSYPNPANESLTIDYKDLNIQPESVIFYDLQGRAVLKKRVDGFQNRRLDVNISALNPGMYIYVIKAQEGSYSGKIRVAR